MKPSSARLGQQRQRATAALQGQDFAKAKTWLDEIVKLAPGDIQAWLALSAVHGEQGDFKQAVSCCRRVLDLDPRNVPALSNLGKASSSMGLHEQAIAAFERLLDLAPGDANVLSDYATTLLRAGRMAEAIDKLEQAIALQPGHVDAQYRLAEVLEVQGRMAEAFQHYQQVIRLQPRLLAVYVKAGNCLQGIADGADVEKFYRQALHVHPDAAELHYGLANVLQSLGRFGEALASVAQGLRLRPDDPVGRIHEANILERQGDFDAAYQRLRALIEKGTVETVAASVFLRLCHRYDCCDEAMAMAERLLSAPSLPPMQAYPLHQALAVVQDRLGRYDDAFAHFARANELIRQPFDAARHAEEVNALLEAFSPLALGKLPRSANQSERPVFIVGMPRSGTTLVEQILASHPLVFGAGELQAMPALMHSLSMAGYPRSLGDLPQARLDELAGKYLSHLTGLNPDALRVTDKLPVNFMHLGLIALLFPKARVIHCVRDPLDTCLSIFFQKFALTVAWSTDLASIGLYYKEYQRLMTHWQQVLDLPILEVRYEDLVADQEALSRRMVEFCGFEWDDRCLQFHVLERAIATPSYDQVRQPVYTSSLNRWKHYEKYLGSLKESLGMTGVD